MARFCYKRDPGANGITSVCSLNRSCEAITLASRPARSRSGSQLASKEDPAFEAALVAGSLRGARQTERNSLANGDFCTLNISDQVHKLSPQMCSKMG